MLYKVIKFMYMLLIFTLLNLHVVSLTSLKLVVTLILYNRYDLIQIKHDGGM